MSENNLGQWLNRQLTKVKQNEPWSDLVQAIGAVMQNHAEEYLDRLKARNSLYDMNKSDILEESKELRQRFPLGNISDSDLAHAIDGRFDEVHFKKTVYPMLSTINREFGGMEVEWIRLYAPVDQEKYPYGTLFVEEDKIGDYSGIAREDFFLTSRGIMRIPVTKIEGGEDGIDDADFFALEANIARVVHPLIPVKNVFDGYIYTITFNLLEAIETVSINSEISQHLPQIDEPDEPVSIADEISDSHTIQEAKKLERRRVTVIGRMDKTPLDALNLDKKHNIETAPVLPKGNKHRPRMCSVFLDAIPLDRVYY